MPRVFVYLQLFVRILCMNVNATNCRTKNSDLRAVAACFHNESFVFNAYYLSDKSADRCDLVAYLKRVTHIADLLLLLLLRSYHKEIERNEHNGDDN